MTRIDSTFAKLEATNRKALVAYLCVGDPSAEESVALALACVDAGADILELGVPFSDPSADGPAIERASHRAVSRGGGLEATLEVARSIRAQVDTPIVLFGYYNPFFVMGDRETAKRASAAGVDALLVVDLPLDEAASLREALTAEGLQLIPLLTPTSRSERIELARDQASLGTVGFIYYVSVTGVTGSLDLDSGRAADEASAIQAALPAPVVVGFGIDGPEKAARAARGTRGVVVGTALVRKVEDGATKDARIADVRALITDIRTGLDRC